MPSKEEHLEQYTINKSLAMSDFMNGKDFKNWKVTVIFYAALHKIDSHYADVCHPGTHTIRKKFLSSIRNYRDIISEYQYLEELSRNARYSCINTTDSEVEEAKELLEHIENFIDNN